MDPPPGPERFHDDPGPGWVEEGGWAGYDDGYDPATDDPDDADPQLPPRDPEFTVTLAITRLRPATLVDPHLVDDPAEWVGRAELRSRDALAGCPVVRSGGRGYRFSAALRRFLVLRSPHCAAPACRAPAHRCDLDHTVAHAAGGPTCSCNAAPLCRRHHTAKHARGWSVIRTSDDPADPSTTWLSPLGYLLTVRSQPLLPLADRRVRAHLEARRRAGEAQEAMIAARPPLGTARVPGASRPAFRLCPGTDHVWDRDCRACEPDVLRRPRGTDHPSPAPPPRRTPTDGEEPPF